MLKAHQACIDLEKEVLRIQGREVRFLAEHELPEKSRNGDIPPELVSVESTPLPNPSGGSGQNAVVSGGASSSRSSEPRSERRYSENSIRTIMDLGVSREVAISTLDAAGGNVDVAASLLF